MFFRKLWYRWFYTQDELEELINEEIDKFNGIADRLPEGKDLMALRKRINDYRK